MSYAVTLAMLNFGNKINTLERKVDCLKMGGREKEIQLAHA